jgi:hypothetical protein
MSMYKEIKTVTTGATEQAVTFTDEHSYVYAKNIGDTDVYLSALSGIVAGADDVALCAAGDTAQICPVGKTIYVLGASTIEFHATNTDNSPFKSAGKGGGSGDGVHFRGSTSTALTDGATTNPITIDGSSYTAVMGDMVIYSNKEFLFDGTSWHEMGDLSDTVGRKYYVSGSPEGEIFNTYDGDYANEASGSHSHAEGFGTIASDSNAHAEGSFTTASGSYSHAEGSGTTASGTGAHAEGGNTTALGFGAHAEGGNTTASGSCSHAEGDSTTASGNCSHAEGYETIASGANSHVSGKYNDFQAGDLFEIGNGTDDNHRSNIVEISPTAFNVNGAIKANGVAIPTAVSLTYTAETEALTLTVS